MEDTDIRWAIGIIFMIAAVVVPIAIYEAQKKEAAEVRQQPLSADVANWNQDRQAYDIPLDNNSTTIRRGKLATFRARPVPDPGAGALAPVDHIVFTPKDRFDQFAWRTPISNISIPANESSTINVFVVDPRLAGQFLEGELTIDFAAEERMQPVKYHIIVRVCRTARDIPKI